MSVLRHLIKRGRYFDSVVLMQLQRQLADLPGIREAGVVMATDANQELLLESKLLSGRLADARPDDLLIAVAAETSVVGDEALGSFDSLLRGRRTQAAVEYRPKSLAVGLQQLPDAGWVLVSVPGRYAADVARKALGAGRNVFLYSDNVPLEDEVDLKATASEKGLLVLGPDCGTAIVAGVGLGFANHVRRGPVGLVGASGTGLQMVSSRLHALGSGVSQAIGTGGRDLTREVGGSTALRALDLLAADEETAVVVVVSKPPHPEVATRVLARARAMDKPVVIQFQGESLPGRSLANVHFAADLEDAATLAHQLTGAAAGAGGSRPVGQGALRGLFSGGTLASEALHRFEAVLPVVSSNLEGHRAARLTVSQTPEGHAILDLGADEFTVGRPHPMIDPQLVVEHLERTAADRTVATILVDVVLGSGAHPDPASLLAPAISEVLGFKDRDRAVLVLIVGTDEDPQDLEDQRSRLEAAGARVFETLGEVVDAALDRVETEAASAGQASSGLEGPLKAVNLGIELFHTSLVEQGAECVHVDWRPPAGGSDRLAAILERLED